jgi:uncharacterized protein RhaS with RHS repeats
MSLLVNRWYDPGVGRWISEDPIGFAGGDANLVRYVGNFAVAAFDPSGLSMWGPREPEPEPPLWKKPFIWVWNAIQPAPGDLSYLMNPIGPAVGLAANLGDDGARAAANSVDEIIAYCRQVDAGKPIPPRAPRPPKVRPRYEPGGGNPSIYSDPYRQGFDPELDK